MSFKRFGGSGKLKGFGVGFSILMEEAPPGDVGCETRMS